jgi:threonine dehydrogenase-like Zn-dependent dehydrogenase
MPEKLRSMVLESPFTLRMWEFPYPEVPEDALVVKMEMVGVCGSDIHAYEGLKSVRGRDLPIILGHEPVGRVYEIGKKARVEMESRGNLLTEGDRVTWMSWLPCGKCPVCKLMPQSTQLCQNPFFYGFTNCDKEENKPWIFGGYGEYIYIKPGTYLFKVDESIPLEAIVMTDTIVSVRGVEKAMTPYPNIKEGFGFMDTVVVQGDGPIGMCAAAKAKALGAGIVIMTGHHESRLKLANDFGVNSVIGPEYDSAEKRVKEVYNITNGRGADLVLGCTGVPLTMLEGIGMTRAGGTYVEIGTVADRGTVPINPALHIANKDIRIMGQKYAPPQQYDRDLKFVEKRIFPFEKLVTHHFKLEEAQEAIETHLKRKSMKTVLLA